LRSYTDGRPEAVFLGTPKLTEEEEMELVKHVVEQGKEEQRRKRSLKERRGR